MKTVLKTALLSLVLMTSSFAGMTQSDEQRAKYSDLVVAKIHELEVLDQLLPILMTKEQIRKLLPVVEKARRSVKDTEEAEYKKIKEIEPKVDALLKKAYDTGGVPSREDVVDFRKQFGKMSVIRMSIAGMNAENLMEVVKKTLNKGQLAAARNALKPEIYDSKLDASKMDDDAKLAFFVKMVMLDRVSYDVMVKLAR
jgi:hypothetical protein